MSDAQSLQVDSSRTLDQLVLSGAISKSQAKAILAKKASKRRLYVVPGVEGVTPRGETVQNLRPAHD